MPVSPCPDCGAPLGGREGCDTAFHELGARAAADVAFAYRRRALVDAYCLQHPAYILSVKSLAAHLCGLCAEIDRPGDPRANRAVWSALQMPPGAVKPPLPETHGSRTIADVHRVVTPHEFRAAVDAWIADVWKAWRDQHALAREWLEFSIAAQSNRPARRAR